MKKLMFTSLLLLCIQLTLHAQLPNIVQRNGYTFIKEWTDDFNTISPNWYIADWTFDDNNCEFASQGVAFSNGELHLTIDKKTAGNMGNYPAKPYWGGEYWTSEKNLYGRYVVDMKPHTPSGVVTSFFLMNIEWNHNYTQALEWSEIDIEFAGNNHEVQFTLHWIDDNGEKHASSNTTVLQKNVTDNFHEWVIEWTPTYISYYLDDELLFTFDDPELLAEQARPQAIHMNNWISIHPGWVGTLNENNLPVTAAYDRLTYYRLDQTTSTKNMVNKKQTLWYDSLNRQIVVNKKYSNKNYQIVNIKGSTVQEGKSKNGIIPIDPSLPNGTYIVNLEGDDKNIKEKISIVF